MNFIVGGIGDLRFEGGLGGIYGIWKEFWVD